MAQTLIERRKDSLLAYRIAEIEADIRDLRTNQAKKLGFGNIVIDGTTGSGSITSNGTSIVNGAGLTANNFLLSRITGGPQTTTSTTYVDIPGSSMNPFTTTATGTSVLVTAIVSGYAGNYVVDDSVLAIQIVDSVNGAIVSFSMGSTWRLTGITQNVSEAITGWTVNTSDLVTTIPAVITLSAGTHTLKLQYKVSGTGTGHADFYYLGYIILGQQY